MKVSREYVRPFSIESNGLMGNYLVRDAGGRIVETGFTIEAATELAGAKAREQYEQQRAAKQAEALGGAQEQP